MNNMPGNAASRGCWRGDGSWERQIVSADNISPVIMCFKREEEVIVIIRRCIVLDPRRRFRLRSNVSVCSKTDREREERRNGGRKEIKCLATKFQGREERSWKRAEFTVLRAFVPLATEIL